MTIVNIVALPAVHGSSTVAFTRPRATSVALVASLGQTVLVLVWLHLVRGRVRVRGRGLGLG